jgi:hypothetical protein
MLHQKWQSVCNNIAKPVIERDVEGVFGDGFHSVYDVQYLVICCKPPTRLKEEDLALEFLNLIVEHVVAVEKANKGSAVSRFNGDTALSTVSLTTDLTEFRLG